MAKKTVRYQQASPVAKAYMLYQTNNHNPYLATFKTGKRNNTREDVCSINVPFLDENGIKMKHTIRIKENSIMFTTCKLIGDKYIKVETDFINGCKKQNGNMVDLNRQDNIRKLKKAFPDLAKVVIDFRKNLKEIMCETTNIKKTNERLNENLAPKQKQQTMQLEPI